MLDCNCWTVHLATEQNHPRRRVWCCSSQVRGLWMELKSNLSDLCHKRLLIMIPCFLPAECYLYYLGSVNAFHNNLRTRCLLSFMSVVLQIPFSIILQKIFVHNPWKRKTRAILGLAYDAIPLCVAWIWKMVRVRNFDRHNAPTPIGLD